MPSLSSFELTEILKSPVARIGVWVLAVLVGLGVLKKLWNWLRQPKGNANPDSALIIRCESQPEKPLAFPVHVRNLSSRLAAVVVAPLGRSTQTPSVGQIPSLIDKFIPGLSKAIEQHGPIVKIWPMQVSKTGFGHALIRHVQIPDDQWRGSRWCIVCGPASLLEQRFIIGFVIELDSPNSMDLISLESDGEWPSIVRVTDS
jgi:hypothetical protein